MGAQRGGWTFGACMVVVGLSAVLLGSRIEHRAFGGHEDPGPRAMPVALGAFLAAGGVAELAGWVLRRRRHGSDPGAGSSGGAVPVEGGGAAGVTAADPPGVPEGGGATGLGRNGWFVLVWTVLYAIALGVFGFLISTLVFAAGTMIWLGVRWWVAAGVAVGLVAAIQLLFVGLLRLQLPGGRFGLMF